MNTVGVVHNLRACRRLSCKKCSYHNHCCDQTGVLYFVDESTRYGSTTLTMLCKCERFANDARPTEVTWPFPARDIS